MPDDDKSAQRDPIRDRVKTLTAKRYENFLDGRLGLIIDVSQEEIMIRLRNKQVNYNN